MKTLLLFRHAKSDHPAGIDDAARPLRPRGERDAERMGRWLARIGPLPERILVSSARRARDTLDIARTAGDWPGEVIVDDAFHTFDGRSLSEALERHAGDAGRVLLVGHQPALGELGSDLCGGGHWRLPTAALVRIDLGIDDWRALRTGCGELRWLLPPKLLR